MMHIACEFCVFCVCVCAPKSSCMTRFLHTQEVEGTHIKASHTRAQTNRPVNPNHPDSLKKKKKNDDEKRLLRIITPKKEITLLPKYIPLYVMEI